MANPEFKPTQPMTQPDTLPAIAPPLPFDATVLFKALQYQLFVAIEQCHGLKPNECLWIEAMGDVTVPGRTQIEVKHYTDSLTDSHHNFWNTIKNWLSALIAAPTRPWYVLALECREALVEVLERMHIIPGEDGLPERVENYKTHYLKPIRQSLQQQYLDDLLGFMFSS
ncbi:hypothetical protein B2J88_35345 [Rhodococcus sp. SRB_17]|uniref:hypothetical protein n=1 Tax=Acidovorax sp. SRB_24 TaxID=1962700 RepID=UPI00145C84E0|nr:hypothetical protein [Acidovorax sp. SRB_24]NMM78317.1 hypothetical protein [Acidovorax sp. SRB_24]NMM89560.1 hypothetical protein [Rhodococcus sp. SRB_17]